MTKVLSDEMSARSNWKRSADDKSLKVPSFLQLRQLVAVIGLICFGFQSQVVASEASNETSNEISSETSIETDRRCNPQLAAIENAPGVDTGIERKKMSLKVRRILQLLDVESAEMNGPILAALEKLARANVLPNLELIQIRRSTRGLALALFDSLQLTLPEFRFRVATQVLEKFYSPANESRVSTGVARFLAGLILLQKIRQMEKSLECGRVQYPNLKREEVLQSSTVVGTELEALLIQSARGFSVVLPNN